MSRALEHKALLRAGTTTVIRTHRQTRKAPDGKSFVLLLGLERSGNWTDMALLYASDQWNAREAASHAKQRGAIDFVAAGSVQELHAMEAPSVPDHVRRAAEHTFYRTYDRCGSAVQAKRESDSLVQEWRQRQHRSSTRRVLIDAQVQELADTADIPPEVIASIKRTDPHPLIAVFRVGKEGMSNGGKKQKFWSFGAIRELAKRISESAGAVIGDTHSSPEDGRVEGKEYVTDSGERRSLLGRIVHSVAQKVGEALEAIAYVHVTDPEAQKKIKAGEYNVCSIDAFCRFDEDPQTGSWFIRQVDKFRNLVIADGRKERPGFAEAGLLATVQELAQEAKHMGDQPTNRALTKADVLVAIEQLRLQPDDLFRDSQLLAVAPVKAAIEAAKSEITKAKDGEIAKLADQVRAGEAIKQKQLLSDAIKGSKHLADKSDKYREYMQDQIKLDLADAKDATDAQKRVDSAIEAELSRMTKYGIKFEGAPANDANGNKGGAGQPPATDAPAGAPNGQPPAGSGQDVWNNWQTSPLHQP